MFSLYISFTFFFPFISSSILSSLSTSSFFFFLSNLTNTYFHSLEFSSTFLHLPFFPLFPFIKHFHSFILPFHSISLSLICSNFSSFSYSSNFLLQLIRNFLFISHFIHQFLPFCFLIFTFSLLPFSFLLLPLPITFLASFYLFLHLLLFHFLPFFSNCNSSSFQSSFL